MKLIKQFFLILISSYSSSLIFCDPITEFIGNYNRSITILEIGQKYSDSLYSIKYSDPKNTMITSVVMLFEESQKLKRRAFEKKYKHMVILEPYDLEPELFRNLGRCEHFDIVIIHSDIYPKIRNFADSYINRFCNLGDYVIFDIDETKISDINRNKLCQNLKFCTKQLGNLENHSFFMHKSNRRGLDIARWNKKYQSESASPRYEIESNFDKKIFIKAGKPALPWVDGINLSTFVMLRGIYPVDSTITDSLTKMSEKMAYHNDLIIGNIIIQGYNLVPIDFADERRSANMEKLLTRAFNVFNGDGRRLKDPIARMRIYSKKKK